MSFSRPSQSSSASSRSRQSARIIAQTTVDAKLDAEFEAMGTCFDYSQSIRAPPDEQRSEKVTAYLQHIQRGKLIQPFGCLLALDEKTFKVLAFSENAPEMLTMVSFTVPSVGDHPTIGIGTDVRNLFTSPSTAALQKALGFAEVSLLNPILVHCKSSGRPFYAIVHRVTGCLIVDFEPVKPSDVPMTAAGALQSYKLAAKAISKLQSLPSGSMEKLCNTVIEEVFELTGYDRVMVYKFHEDDHGEVFAEITKPGLESYFGLHYPATDIPQAARFLFMKNKVRMICDCHAKHVKVYQDKKLPFDISFCGSTLRASHSCHLQYMENMNSIASLVMAVVVNEGEEDGGNEAEENSPPHKRKRLWGLVVCHNESPRFVPFPLRYACEFLMQVFAIHVNKELELENLVKEKKILRTQTMLCDMLLREFVPLGIITQTPNIMDLVKCDGAAFLYQDKIWRLGVTPSEPQIYDIVHWLSACHMDSTGLSTDNLHEAGYPGVSSLGDVVCGMAVARITSKDMLFWFRSPTAASIRWGGAKHDPTDKDDGRKMHPRSSFKAFLEVAKMRSLPWGDHEMNAIHSLQLILRDTLNGIENKANKAIIDPQLNELKLEGMVEVVTNEMVRLIETATVPILAVDADGLINGWNMKIAQLTGLSDNEARGKHLLTIVEDSSIDVVKRMLLLALQGIEEQNVQFQVKTSGVRRDDGPLILVVNACVSRDIHSNVVGACFVAQDVTGQKFILDKFTKIEGDYKAIVQNPCPLIPPIFGTDEFGWCSEWNLAMTKLSGWKRDEVMDKMLLGEVFGINTSCCRMKSQDALVNFSILISNAFSGQETEKSPFSFMNRSGKHVDCLLSVSRKVDVEGNLTGIFCFVLATGHELQQSQPLVQQETVKRMKALAYIRNEIRNPLSGIMYTRKMLVGTNLDEEQSLLLSTGAKCHNQLNRILEDLNLEDIMNSCLELEMNEFNLKDVVLTAVSQVMLPSEGKGVNVVYDLPDGLLSEYVYGDSLRLQQILADFLLVCVKYSPDGAQVEITANLKKETLGKSLQLIHVEIRITHAGNGVAEELLSEMFGSKEDTSEEGMSLLVCRKLLRLMNGDVCYLREANKSVFILSAELACASKQPKDVKAAV